MNSRKETREPDPAAMTGSQPLEDRALKEAARLFGQELMPLIGIPEKVQRIAPTEQVYLNLKDLSQDFNYEMMDQGWTHLEFESDSIRTKDLKRFRSYEAVMSYCYDVDVKTYVICSSRVRKLKSSLRTGFNTYRVKIVRLKDKDAGQKLRMAEQKQQSGHLERSDLLEILLTPLMNGPLSQRERIERGIRLLKGERGRLKQEELAGMEAVLYTFAMKFLTLSELKEIKEMMNMTVLGEMILQDGITQGIAKGAAQINRLNQILIGAGRLDDLKRASEDAVYQELLIQELLSSEQN